MQWYNDILWDFRDERTVSFILVGWERPRKLRGANNIDPDLTLRELDIGRELKQSIESGLNNLPKLGKLRIFKEWSSHLVGKKLRDLLGIIIK